MVSRDVGIRPRARSATPYVTQLAMCKGHVGFEPWDREMCRENEGESEVGSLVGDRKVVMTAGGTCGDVKLVPNGAVLPIWFVVDIKVHSVFGNGWGSDLGKLEGSVPCIAVPRI